MEFCPSHKYEDIEELHTIRHNLLRWYDQNKRELPWRTLAFTEKDTNIRAYGVWVSEIMLQQTQVATVVDYYNRWMSKWPTVEALASATVEATRVFIFKEVHAAWAGMGYYSRGERLLKGAKKVVSDMGGVIPDTAQELMKQLPGVGRYTAGAIASIAFNKVASIVDGNVARVLSRQRVIGGQAQSKAVTTHLWELAEMCVDNERPGDFNQALMELGATVCTPKAPLCQDCPIATLCLSNQKVQNKGSPLTSRSNVADSPCQLCLKNWRDELGVMNYPCKVTKKAPLAEEFNVAVIEDEMGLFLLQKRPSTGLLAGMWEFPSVMVTCGSSYDQMWKELLGDAPKGRQIGTVTHLFSHRRHLYHCWHMQLAGDHDKSTLLSSSWLVPSSSQEDTLKWVGRQEIKETGVPASVNKIIQLLDLEMKPTKKRSNPTGLKECSKRQKTLSCFFSNTATSPSPATTPTSATTPTLTSM